MKIIMMKIIMKKKSIENFDIEIIILIGKVIIIKIQ